MKREDIKNRNVLIVGMGRSGVSAAKVLVREGCRVTIVEREKTHELERLKATMERYGVRVKLGPHSKDDLKDIDIVVTSPGVPREADPLRWAQDEALPIISEIEVGYILSSSPLVAITGTNGKSTTAALTGHILNRLGRKAIVCGNIGRPLTDVLDEADGETVLVCEVSSFQLEWIDSFHPDLALVLNITPNHLDRYASFSAYQKAKLRIFENQTPRDWAILNADDPGLKDTNIEANVLWYSLKDEVSAGGELSRDGLRIHLNGKDIHIDHLKTSLKGRDNLGNSLASLLVGAIYGGDGEAMAHLIKDFVPLEHRLEDVRTYQGMDFINDSKSTTVAATRCALETISPRFAAKHGGTPPEAVPVAVPVGQSRLGARDGKRPPARPVILIAGGRDKRQDYSSLRGIIGEKVKDLILIGEAAGKIEEALGGLCPIYRVPSLKEAVSLSIDLGVSGDTVLFSPMCASFDMFRDFEERGRVFKEIVNRVPVRYPRGTVSPYAKGCKCL